jgi:membrane protein implicated in regulation of membrane protease activity
MRRRPLRAILLTLGVLATLMGLLWIGQGLGYVHWPKSSFMLDQRPWANRGAVLAVIGLVLIMVGRRLRR